MNSFLKERLRLTLSTDTAIPPLDEASSVQWTSVQFLVYCSSCFSYALLALYAMVRGFTVPLCGNDGDNASLYVFPGVCTEVGLLYLQSICSFGCDAWSFGKASIWKPLDRTVRMNFPSSPSSLDFNRSDICILVADGLNFCLLADGETFLDGNGI